MKKAYRFTLVELLAVVALIAILSAIGFGSYSYAMGRAKESSTQALLKQLEAGLESFHAKNGYYPQSGGTFQNITVQFDSTGVVSSLDFGSSTGKLVRATGTARADRMKTELLESFTRSLDVEALKKHLNASGVIEDAWGAAVYYCAPGRFNKGSFDLISAGPDGKFGKDGANDPTEITDRTQYRTDAGEALCDDLFNF